ncbi:hypothetical protein [Algirhabdus cladophorae]|uniref:hypothetical protein n=1 Tax=Algirhabdus cladophorae TaxID=3377108 RepID=UPI003B849FFB
MTLTLTGRLQAEGAMPWFLHRGRLLNLVGWITRQDDRTIAMVLSGPADLLDAMEVACSLGPADVWVESYTRSSYEFETLPEALTIRESA